MTTEEIRDILREHGMRDDIQPWTEGTAKKLIADPNDYYADYSAWEEWFGEKAEDPCLNPKSDDCNCQCCEFALWWDDFDMLLRIKLYAIFSGTRGH